MIRRLVYLAVHWIVPLFLLLIAASAKAGVLVAFVVLWLIFGFRPAMWLARLLATLVISHLPCPRCGVKIEAVNIWSAGGYVDHVERHVLAFRSPLTGDRIGWVHCPNCQSTILL